MHGIQFPTDPMMDQFLSSVCVCESFDTMHTIATSTFCRWSEQSSLAPWALYCECWRSALAKMMPDWQWPVESVLITTRSHKVCAHCKTMTTHDHDRWTFHDISGSWRVMVSPSRRWAFSQLGVGGTDIEATNETQTLWARHWGSSMFYHVLSRWSCIKVHTWSGL